MTAFATARSLVTPQRRALGKSADQIEPAILNTMLGYYFWGPFASLTATGYETIAGVERQRTGHPLEHVWRLGNEIVLRMKSEIDQLSNEQLMLESDEMFEASPSLVVLTWQHLGSERHDPVFVGMDNGKAVWSLPIEAIMAHDVETVQPKAPKAVVKLAKDQSARHSDEQQS